MPNTIWRNLNPLQLGKYAEYYVAMELTSYGFYVYKSEVDDHGIDFVIKNLTGTYIDIQVKSARRPQTSYVFASKDKFDVNQLNLYMALLLFEEGRMPDLYFIPSAAWQNPNALLRDRHYESKKSKPEWGLNISNKNLDLLSAYEMTTVINTLSII